MFTEISIKIKLSPFGELFGRFTNLLVGRKRKFRLTNIPNTNYYILSQILYHRIRSPVIRPNFTQLGEITFLKL